MPKEEKTVDIDTTGPGAEVNIEEEKNNLHDPAEKQRTLQKQHLEPGFPQ